MNEPDSRIGSDRRGCGRGAPPRILVLPRAGCLTSIVLVAFLGREARALSQSTLYEGSVTEKAARQRGRKLVKEIPIQIDGGGQTEVGIVEALSDGKMVLSVLEPTSDPDDEERTFKVLAEGSGRPASTLVRLEAKAIAGSPPPELLAVFEDPSPDETAIHIRIMGATNRGVREVFAQTFFVPKPSPSPVPLVELGDASPHFSIVDLDEEGGDQEIVWVREPERLELKAASGPIAFVIGARRTVFRYDRGKDGFAEAAQDAVDFLEPKPAYEVSASSQVGKIWGTAQAFWATDGDPGTSWSIEAPRGAVGQSLTVKFKGAPEISMIRVIPGCAAGPEAWGGHYRIRVFRLVLSSGQKLEIDRRKLDRAVSGVKAAGEFPLEGGFGAQVLVFLSEPQALKWIRFEVMELEDGRERRIGEACVSEVSFH